VAFPAKIVDKTLPTAKTQRPLTKEADRSRQMPFAPLRNEVKPRKGCADNCGESIEPPLVTV